MYYFVYLRAVQPGKVFTGYNQDADYISSTDALVLEGHCRESALCQNGVQWELYLVTGGTARDVRQSDLVYVEGK